MTTPVDKFIDLYVWRTLPDAERIAITAWLADNGLSWERVMSLQPVDTKVLVTSLCAATDSAHLESGCPLRTEGDPEVVCTVQERLA